MMAFESQLLDLDAQRQRAQGLAVRGAMTDEELDVELARIEADRATLERHVASLAPPDHDEPIDVDLLEELRSRLDAGLMDAERQEIVRLLVGRITITTIVNEDGTKDAKATISYRFPGVVATRTGTPAGLDYTNVQRIAQLPPGGRWPRRVATA